MTFLIVVCRVQEEKKRRRKKRTGQTISLGVTGFSRAAAGLALPPLQGLVQRRRLINSSQHRTTATRSVSNTPPLLVFRTKRQNAKNRNANTAIIVDLLKNLCSENPVGKNI
jgi:hypothetical protein